MSGPRRAAVLPRPSLTLLLSLAAPSCRAEPPVVIADNLPGEAFETIAPEAAGWSAERLAEAKSWSQHVAPTAAVMIVQHGRIVAEWGGTAVKSNLHSIRKSLLSALIGIAVDAHQIDPAATIGSLGIDDNAPGLTDVEQTATVADLLKARSGTIRRLAESRRVLSRNTNRAFALLRQ